MSQMTPREIVAELDRHIISQADAKRAAVVEHWAEERSKGLFATSRISDDGMIDPRDTRAIIAMSLSACYNNKVEGTKEFGTWRM